MDLENIKNLIQECLSQVENGLEEEKAYLIEGRKYQKLITVKMNLSRTVIKLDQILNK